MIITIGRQLGSGGLEIGRLLAERLNLAFYDKELLTEAARHSGICPECFQQVDEQAKRTFGGVGIFGMRFPFVGDGNTSYNSMISGDNLFLIQSEAEARDMMKKVDKQRSAYYDYYASREWGVASSYDICINSSLLGIEGTVEAIINIVRGK